MNHQRRNQAASRRIRHVVLLLPHVSYQLYAESQKRDSIAALYHLTAADADYQEVQNHLPQSCAYTYIIRKIPTLFQLIMMGKVEGKYTLEDLKSHGYTTLGSGLESRA